MAIHLAPDLEELIEGKVRSGRYGSTDDVLREALELLEERDEMSVLRKGEVRKQIEEGWNDARQGNLVDGETVFDRILGELRVTEQSSGR